MKKLIQKCYVLWEFSASVEPWLSEQSNPTNLRILSVFRAVSNSGYEIMVHTAFIPLVYGSRGGGVFLQAVHSYGYADPCVKIPTTQKNPA